MTAVFPPAGFPLVGLSLVGAIVLAQWQGARVMGHRKAAGVSYPTMLVSEAEAKADPKKMAYNCAQRAHQNTVENLAGMLAGTIFIGVYNPVLAASGLGLWIFGRIFYTLQYSSGVPGKRNNGFALVAYPGLFTVFFGSLYYAISGSIRYLKA